jgi:predicted CXXCH cytochrome family protein
MNKCWWGVKLAACGVLALMLGLVCSGDASGAYVDCGMCHIDPAPGSGTPDYVDFFVSPQRQHPTGIAYPAQDPDFARPTALGSEVSFFDTNGNGVADLDEVQLFGAGHKVECASCHREHGDAPPPPRPNMYLRVGNQLCSVCHRL